MAGRKHGHFGLHEHLACKTIAVVGATGGVGLETVYQALASGNKVRALCRNPEKLVVPAGSGGETKAGTSLLSPDLEIIQGDVTKKEDVAKLLDDSDISGVVVALGGRTKEVGKTMLTDGTKNVIESMKSKDLTNIAVVTSIGAGDSYEQAPLAFKLFMWTILKDAFVDKNAQESLFLDPAAPGGDLDFVIVRPGGLTLGQPTGQARVLAASEMAGSIARADVASFCLEALEGSPYTNKAVCIS